MVHKCMDIGGRDKQEDAVAVSGAILVLADGMGGHAGGGTASRVAVRAIVQELDNHAREQDLSSAFQWACRCIQDEGGGGTTLLVARIHDGEALLAWVGDSRAYLVHDGVAELLTDDHVGSDGGLCRWLPDEGEPDFTKVTLEPGARIVLCSDGVSNVLSAEEIGEAAEEDEPAEALVAAAIDAGTDDNCSAIVWVT